MLEKIQRGRGQRICVIANWPTQNWNAKIFSHDDQETNLHQSQQRPMGVTKPSTRNPSNLRKEPLLPLIWENLKKYDLSVDAKAIKMASLAKFRFHLPTLPTP